MDITEIRRINLRKAAKKLGSFTLRAKKLNKDLSQISQMILVGIVAALASSTSKRRR